jgi:hypothetical protein
MALSPQRAIVDTIRKRLPADVVDSIDIEDGSDSDGEPILKITVVLKKGARLRDRKAMISLARYIRAILPDDPRFPLIDFISAGDAARRKRAAA